MSSREKLNVYIRYSDGREKHVRYGNFVQDPAGYTERTGSSVNHLNLGLSISDALSTNGEKPSPTASYASLRIFMALRSDYSVEEAKAELSDTSHIQNFFDHEGVSTVGQLIHYLDKN